MTNAPYDTSLNERLKQAFSLTEDDLVANRTGHLTSLQQGQLRRKRTLYTLGMLAGIVLCLVLAVSSILGRERLRSPRYDPYMGAIGLVCFTIPILLFGLYEVRRIAQDANNNEVASLQGVISRRVKTKGIRKSYRVVSQGEGFDINRDQYEAFTENGRYILYYTPRSKMLVAAEIMASSPS